MPRPLRLAYLRIQRGLPATGEAQHILPDHWHPCCSRPEIVHADARTSAMIQHASDINRKSYNAIASSWDAARHSFYGRERYYLDIFLDGLPVPSRILDLGCGTGRPMAEYILSQGHDLTGVDQAAELLALASRRFPQGKWIESSIQDFHSTNHFAGVVCWDALFHIERSLHAGVLLRIAKILCAGGRLMLTMGGSDHPPFTDTMFGATFFYDSYPPGEALSILHRLGFDPLVTEIMNEPTAGRDKGRYAIVAQITRAPF